MHRYTQSASTTDNTSAQVSRHRATGASSNMQRCDAHISASIQSVKCRESAYKRTLIPFRDLPMDISMVLLYVSRKDWPGSMDV